MDNIQEIKQRLNITDLSVRFGLQPNSSNFINSIYKEDKTPSLKLYPDTNSFYCFATNQGGDIIKFYEDYYKVDTATAIKELCDILGINNQNNEQSFTRNEERATPYYPQQTEKKYYLFSDFEKEIFEERINIVHYENPTLADESVKELAFKSLLSVRKGTQNKLFDSLYRFNIEKGLDGQIYNYLKGNKRGLTDKTIEDFKLFSINSVKENIEFLRDSFTRYELSISGLFKNKYFMFSKHRLIIPYIEDNKITYLRGRYFYKGNFIPDRFGKYIGLSNKSLTLSPKRFFNIDQLNKTKPYTALIITEGEFDCMIATQYGSNSIGVAGTSNFPKEEIKLLDKYNVHLAFDNDEAGEIAVDKIATLFNKPIKQIILKNKKDFSEFFNYER